MTLCGEVLDRVLSYVKAQGDNYTYGYDNNTIEIFAPEVASLLIWIPSGNDFGDQLKELQSTLDDYEDLVTSLSKSKKVLWLLFLSFSELIFLIDSSRKLNIWAR